MVGRRRLTKTARLDGKIKAAAYGAAGRSESAGPSNTLYDVRLHTTACHSLQLIDASMPATPRVHRCRKIRGIEANREERLPSLDAESKHHRAGLTRIAPTRSEIRIERLDWTIESRFGSHRPIDVV